MMWNMGWRDRRRTRMLIPPQGSTWLDTRPGCMRKGYCHGGPCIHESVQLTHWPEWLLPPLPPAQPLELTGCRFVPDVSVVSVPSLP